MLVSIVYQGISISSCKGIGKARSVRQYILSNGGGLMTELKNWHFLHCLNKLKTPPPPQLFFCTVDIVMLTSTARIPSTFIIRCVVE